MFKKVLVGIVLTALAVGLVLQQMAIRALRTELAQITNGGAGNSRIPAEPSTPNSSTASGAVGPHSEDGPVQQRLSVLEEQVRQLTLASELLMEKGQFPLSEAKAAQLKRKFLEASLPERERLEVLRALHRNNAIDDEILRAGLAWIDVLTDARLIRDVVEQLSGLKSPALRDKMLQLVATHLDTQVRQQAVQALAGLVDDPLVESALWKALASEQDRNVQRQLEDALRDGRMPPERQTELQRRTLDTGLSFRERLVAFRAMSSAKVADAQTTATFVDSVVNQNRAEEMADLFRTLDNTGNLAAAPALIKGLQTDNPELRMLALDALSEMQSDATVVKWLQYVANNDKNELVRAEATRVLAQSGGKP